jgi:hypothetical protein
VGCLVVSIAVEQCQPPSIRTCFVKSVQLSPIVIEKLDVYMIIRSIAVA